ncbi:16761_t:CDS:2, partial [Racocetra fulgida]
MKKSWHPLLIKNQERVWKEEQKALEEQKKLTQLMKEKEEERQLQELRKLQESAGGKKGPERLDWMYAAGPNQSSSAKAQELEDFLLGKKSVDKLIDNGTALITTNIITQKGDIGLAVGLYLPQENVIGVAVLYDGIIMKGMIIQMMDDAKKLTEERRKRVDDVNREEKEEE